MAEEPKFVWLKELAELGEEIGPAMHEWITLIHKEACGEECECFICKDFRNQKRE